MSSGNAGFEFNFINAILPSTKPIITKNYINTQLLNALMKKLLKLFSRKEQFMIFLTSFIIAFILSFDEWGKETFDFTVGIGNLLLVLIVTIISLFIKISVQKYFSKKRGFEAEFSPWILGFIFGILLALITNGKFIFLAFGGLIFYIIEKLKLGEPRTNIDFALIGWLSILGPLTNIILAAIVKMLVFLPNSLILKIISVNFWMALYGMIPLPFIHKFKVGGEKKFGTSDGLKLLFASPLEYIIVTVVMVINAVIVVSADSVVSLLATLVCTVFIWLVYNIFYKLNITKGSGKNYKYRIE